MEQEIAFTIGTVTVSMTMSIEVIPPLPPPPRVWLTDEQVRALTRPFEPRYAPGKELSIFGPQG